MISVSPSKHNTAVLTLKDDDQNMISITLYRHCLRGLINDILRSECEGCVGDVNIKGTHEVLFNRVGLLCTGKFKILAGIFSLDRALLTCALIIVVDIEDLQELLNQDW